MKSASVYEKDFSVAAFWLINMITEFETPDLGFSTTEPSSISLILCMTEYIWGSISSHWN